MKVPIYILAGGRSTRFGRDKARAEYRGRPLLLHVADALRPCATEVVVVAGEEGQYEDLDLRTIADLRPGLGPLSGLQAAIDDCAEPVLLMTSCDMLGLDSDWAKFLFEHIGEAPAIAFKDEHWQPLFALYETSLAPEVQAALGEGRHAMWRFLERVDAVSIQTPPGWERVTSINTPEELERYRRET